MSVGEVIIRNMAKKIFLQFFKGHILSYCVGVVCMMLASYIQTLFPKVLGEAIDILKQDGFSRRAVEIKILDILLIAAATFVLTCGWRNLVNGNARKMECYIREQFFRHLQKMSPAFYSTRHTGDLIAYGINDISAVRSAFGPTSAMAINGIVICAASIYSMAVSIDWRLTLMTLIPVPVIVAFTLRAGIKIKRRFRRVQERFAAISGKVNENINGIRVIKAFVQEESEIRNFEKLNDQMTGANLDMVKISAALTPVIEICFSISFVLNLVVGGNLVLAGTISLGSFVAFNTYLTMIMNPIISIGKVINSYQRGMASLSRLNEIFNIEPEVRDREEARPVRIRGEVEFRDLTFRYPGASENTLESVSFRLPKGRTLGIVGRTGAGKSTLVNLLMHLYNVQDGHILIDGQDINSITLKSLRKGIAIAPQRNFLFSTTIGDNIRFFSSDFSDDDIEAAAKEGCIYENIQQFDDGFETELGERGVNLSGGQKQRVSISRSVIRHSPILIMDDTLSAVDTVTESNILGNLRKERGGKTNIIIAHRISAVRDADEIIVLDHGRIVERGSHAGLIEKGGLYYDIYQEQAKQSEDAVKKG